LADAKGGSSNKCKFPAVLQVFCNCFIFLLFIQIIKQSEVERQVLQ